MNVTCPRCSKMFEHPEGSLWTTCPHCGAANTDAVAVVRNLELKNTDADASTAISTRPLPDGRATCPRCGKRFDRPDDPATPWLSCPFCHEVNPDALVTNAVKGSRGAGVFLLVLGTLGLTLGTCLCGIGMRFARHFGQPVATADWIDITVVGVWALASLAVIATGAFLTSPAKVESVQRNYWGPGAFFLILMLAGIAGWIFAFSTCTFLAR